MNQSTVMMTGDEFTDGSIPVREIRENGLGPMKDPISSPLGSFQSLHRSQSSEKDKMIPYVSPLEEIGVLQFEKTLSETDCRNFNLIYESLLLEGKAGNLMDLTVGMVLAKKPPAWLQVMHGRLKHLIISSEVFQKKKKAEYNAWIKVKQLRTDKEKRIGKHSMGITHIGHQLSQGCGLSDNKVYCLCPGCFSSMHQKPKDNEFLKLSFNSLFGNSDLQKMIIQFTTYIRKQNN